MTTPAEEFAAFLAQQVPESVTDTPAAPADVTRAPRPNPAQGAGSDPPRPDPAQEFAQLFNDALYGERNGGFRR